MSLQPCEPFASKLVEFADGELPAAEADAVREHLQVCPHCRVTVEALQKSLNLTQQIWTKELWSRGETSLVLSVGFSRRTVRVRWLRWPLRIAAGIALALGVWTAWRSVLPEGPQAPVVQTPEQVEAVVARAGVSAQLLGAAEYLVENGAGELARERLIYLVDAYPETDAAAVARSRLKSERITQ